MSGSQPLLSSPLGTATVTTVTVVGCCSHFVLTQPRAHDASLRLYATALLKKSEYQNTTWLLCVRCTPEGDTFTKIEQRITLNGWSYENSQESQHWWDSSGKCFHSTNTN